MQDFEKKGNFRFLISKPWWSSGKIYAPGGLSVYSLFWGMNKKQRSCDGGGGGVGARGQNPLVYQEMYKYCRIHGVEAFFTFNCWLWRFFYIYL
jgi:hypothetical protein